MSGERHKESLRTAIDAVGVAPAPSGVPTAEQLALPGVARAVAQPDQGDSVPSATSRGPGRPPGARNRRTQEWCDYILAHNLSPLVFLAEVISRPMVQLAREFECNLAEAFRIQLQAAKRLAP